MNSENFARMDLPEGDDLRAIEKTLTQSENADKDMGWCVGSNRFLERYGVRKGDYLGWNPHTRKLSVTFARQKTDQEVEKVCDLEAFDVDPDSIADLLRDILSVLEPYERAPGNFRESRSSSAYLGNMKFEMCAYRYHYCLDVYPCDGMMVAPDLPNSRNPRFSLTINRRPHWREKMKTCLHDRQTV